jgi:hypothetical protein
MEEIHRTENGLVARSLCDLFITPPTQHVHVFTNPETLKPFPLGFIWKLHYTDMTDINYWPLMTE